MSYGRTAPKGVPQAVWDDAIDLWLNLSTADSDDIKTIADRLVSNRAEVVGALVALEGYLRNTPHHNAIEAGAARAAIAKATGAA